jgi:hypothetical protein
MVKFMACSTVKSDFRPEKSRLVSIYLQFLPGQRDKRNEANFLTQETI